MATDDDLRRLEQDFGLKRLYPGWAKLEILFGLSAVMAGLLGAMRTVLAELPDENAVPWSLWVGREALGVLGGYLALAGHRSHLYQSNNRLAAYLAAQLRHPGTRS